MKYELSKNIPKLVFILLTLTYLLASPASIADGVISGTSVIPAVNSTITEPLSYDLSVDSCTAYFTGNAESIHACRYGEVPPQVAFWLFLLAIFGFIGFLNRNKL